MLSKFRWFVLFVVVFGAIAQGTVLIWPAPLMEEIARLYHQDLGATTGMMMVSFSVLVAVSGVIGGICCDKYGWIKTLLVSNLVLALATVMTPIAASRMDLLLVSRLLGGLGAGPTMAAVGVVSVEWFREEERGLFLGIQGIGLPLGIAIGFVLSPSVFIKTHSFVYSAVVSSIFPMLTVVLIVCVMVVAKSSGYKNIEYGHVDNKHEFKVIAKYWMFTAGILCVFTECWIMQAFNDLTPVYLSAAPPLGVGHGVVVAGKCMGLVQVAFMLGSMASGVLLNRVFGGRNRTLIAVAFAGVVVFALSIKIDFVNSNLTILPFCLFLTGFCEGLIIPASLAFISMNFPASIVGKSTGIWMGVGIFGGTVGVVVGSILLHATKNYNASIIAVGLISVIGVLISFGLRFPDRLMAQAEND